jgi:zinc and cadmium transporter
MQNWSGWLLIAYCLLITAASWAGGHIPTRLRLSHTGMQVLMSFVAGLMLGVALLHMLPHATHHLPSLDWAVKGVLVGLLAMFFLIRVSHFHQHHGHDEPVLDSEIGSTCDHAHAAGDEATPHDHRPHPSHHHGHHHDHDHAGQESAAQSGKHEMSWMGLALGLSIHTLIDGMALGASVAAETTRNSSFSLAGIGTFLAILLHKPLDAMSIVTLMTAAKWPAARQRAVNLLFALMCPIGALLFWVGTKLYIATQHELLGCSLAFSAGVFLCISLGDLLPEVHFHRHDRVKLSIALLVGVLLAFLVGFLEPNHAHEVSYAFPVSVSR